MKPIINLTVIWYLKKSGLSSVCIRTVEVYHWWLFSCILVIWLSFTIIALLEFFFYFRNKRREFVLLSLLHVQTFKKNYAFTVHLFAALFIFNDVFTMGMILMIAKEGKQLPTPTENSCENRDAFLEFSVTWGERHFIFTSFCCFMLIFCIAVC